MTQFYSGAVVCAPSRGVFLTGRYTIHTGVTTNGSDIPESETTMAEALKARGYATGLVGKWHRGRTQNWVHPNRQGFDYFFGFVDATAAHDYYPKEFWENGQTQANTGYATDRFTEKALAFIEANKSHPFFLYLAYTAPHFKIEAPADAVAHYKGWFEEKDAANPLNATYAAMVSRMDDGIGKVLDRLGRLVLDRNTLVVFSSDQGATFEPGNQGTADYHDSNYPFRGGKRTVNEGGVRVPLIARWPGRIPASTTAAVVAHAIDIFPTILAAASGRPDPAWNLDGVSLLDEWTSGAKIADRPLFWEWRQEGSHALAVRAGDWKLIQLGEVVELYDLRSDAAERRNLASAYRDVVSRLKGLLQNWIKSEVSGEPGSVR